MWKSEKSPPILEFLGWTFLIFYISWAISFTADKTGTLSVGWVNVINTIQDTFIAGFSPLTATYIILKRHHQITGVREFITRIFHVRNVKKSLLITTAFCCTVLFVSILIGERTDFSWFMIIPAIPLMVFYGGVEEVGWRGFLQPAFEKRMPFVPSVLIVSAIWSVWHIPLWFVSTSLQSKYDFLPYALQLTVFAFVLAAIYKVSKSPILCVFYHAWFNAIGAIYEWRLFATYPTNTILLVFDVILIIVAIVIFTSHKDDELKIEIKKNVIY
jgi:membrane protease YdiL (CAAX protease family)